VQRSKKKYFSGSYFVQIFLQDIFRPKFIERKISIFNFLEFLSILVNIFRQSLEFGPIPISSTFFSVNGLAVVSYLVIHQIEPKFVVFNCVNNSCFATLNIGNEMCPKMPNSKFEFNFDLLANILIFCPKFVFF